MNFSRVLAFILMLSFAGSCGIAEAAMVDFELPDYTAGSSFVGVDGWANFSTAVSVVTPDPGGSGNTTVLSGSQSGLIGTSNSATPRTIMCRKVDTGGPAEWTTGTIYSGHMLAVSGPAGGAAKAEFWYSQAPMTASSCAGISGIVGGNFNIWGKSSASTYGYVDTGIAFSTGVDYLLEIELDVDDPAWPKFEAYATDVTNAGTRTSLGTLGLYGTIRSDYGITGFNLVTRGNAIAVYDDLDVYVVSPPPPVLQPGKVTFELPTYVSGTSVVGVDGWKQALGAADAVITNTNVLAGSQSLFVKGSGTSGRSCLQRNFGPETTYEDGSIISARMKMTGGTGDSRAEFFFSHNQTNLNTPAGIIGVQDDNFYIFGLQNGVYEVPNLGTDTGIPFQMNVDYLLEMQFDFTNQIFYSYMTDITNGGQRTMLGYAEFIVSEPIEPGDDSNSGYVAIARNFAEVVYDEFDLVSGTLPVIKPGDVNKDGTVDERDCKILAANWLAGPEATWKMGDFNDDGYVNDLDAALMAANWTGTGASASVPEPSILAALIGLCIGALFIRRGN